MSERSDASVESGLQQSHAREPGQLPRQGGTIGGVICLLGGVIALANPFWLAELTFYPGTDWTFLPLIHAAVATIGVIGIGAGVRWSVFGSPKPAAIGGLVIAVTAVVFVPLYWHVALVLTGIPTPILESYGARRSLVAGLIAAGYLIGIAIVDRDRLLMLIAVGAPVGPAFLVAEEWTRGALLEPILEAHFFLTGAPIGGIDNLGTWLFLGVIMWGAVVGWLDRSRPRTRSAAPKEAR